MVGPPWFSTQGWTQNLVFHHPWNCTTSSVCVCRIVSYKHDLHPEIYSDFWIAKNKLQSSVGVCLQWTLYNLATMTQHDTSIASNCTNGEETNPSKMRGGGPGVYSIHWNHVFQLYISHMNVKGMGIHQLRKCCNLRKCVVSCMCVCVRNLLLNMAQSKNRIHLICHLAISIQLISSVSLVFQIPRHHIVLPVSFQVGSCNLAKWLPPSLQSFFGLIPKWLNGVLKGLGDIRIGHEGFWYGRKHRRHTSFSKSWWS